MGFLMPPIVSIIHRDGDLPSCSGYATRRSFHIHKDQRVAQASNHRPYPHSAPGHILYGWLIKVQTKLCLCIVGARGVHSIIDLHAYCARLCYRSPLGIARDIDDERACRFTVPTLESDDVFQASSSAFQRNEVIAPQSIINPCADQTTPKSGFPSRLPNQVIKMGSLECEPTNPDMTIPITPDYPMTTLKAASLGNLRGRVALVTGGATGIGEIIAKTYAVNGARVYICGRRVDVLKKCAMQHPNLIPLVMDVTDKNSIAHAARIVEETEGRLDILVNSAGIPGPISHFMVDKNAPENATLGESLFRMHNFETWHQVFDTNFTGTFFVTTKFLKLLEEGARIRGGETSVVINICSACSMSKLSLDMIPYGSLKAGLDHMTIILAAEFARNELPVRVVGISPGLFPSEMANKGGIDIEEFGRRPLLSAMNPGPLKRLGTEEEMGGIALFLASSSGGFTNGVVIRVDGGHNLINP